jgi:hypothetical protein
MKDITFLEQNQHGQLRCLPFDAPDSLVSTADGATFNLKLAAAELHYPMSKGIPIEWINTHSLRSGGANALALAGHSDTQI